MLRRIPEGFSIAMEVWRAASMMMMVLRWWSLRDDMQCQHIILLLRVSPCCVGASASFTTRCESSFHSETQIMQIAERVDMRGNRGGRYISSPGIFIGLSKSLPPLLPHHLSSTIRAPITARPHQSLRINRIGFYLSWGGWRRGAIGREGERGRWMEQEQLRLC